MDRSLEKLDHRTALDAEPLHGDYNTELHRLMDAVREFAEQHGGWLGNKRENVASITLQGALSVPGSLTVQFAFIEPGHAGRLEITDHNGFQCVFDGTILPRRAALIGLVAGQLGG